MVKTSLLFFSYTFKLIYQKGSRKNEASVTVDVKSGDPPKVFIRPLALPKINPTEKFAIRALIKSKKTITATWTCVEEDGKGNMCTRFFFIAGCPRVFGSADAF